MLESYVERKVCDYAKRRGWLVRKLQWIGRHGAPDRVFVKSGRIVFVEFKAPGRKPTKNQEQEIARLRREGCEVHVVDDIEVGKAIFADAFLRPRSGNHDDII